MAGAYDTYTDSLSALIAAAKIQASQDLTNTTGETFTQTNLSEIQHNNHDDDDKHQNKDEHDHGRHHGWDRDNNHNSHRNWDRLGNNGTQRHEDSHDD